VILANGEAEYFYQDDSTAKTLSGPSGKSPPLRRILFAITSAAVTPSKRMAAKA
jgi:hypothetical protein